MAETPKETLAAAAGAMIEPDPAAVEAAAGLPAFLEKG